jgi:hypothetical protein
LYLVDVLLLGGYSAVISAAGLWSNNKARRNPLHNSQDWFLFWLHSWRYDPERKQHGNWTWTPIVFHGLQCRIWYLCRQLPIQNCSLWVSLLWVWDGDTGSCISCPDHPVTGTIWFTLHLLDAAIHFASFLDSLLLKWRHYDWNSILLTSGLCWLNSNGLFTLILCGLLARALEV